MLDRIISEITNNKAKYFGFMLLIFSLVITCGVFFTTGSKQEVFIQLFKKYADAILNVAILALGVSVGRLGKK